MRNEYDANVAMQHAQPGWVCGTLWREPAPKRWVRRVSFWQRIFNFFKG